MIRRKGFPPNIRKRNTLMQMNQQILLDFSVLSLFANGEQGAWYDPSDLSTLFQDSAGTTPVTAHGQPVGLMLDKSGRGNHAIQATPASRPLFQDVGGLRYLKFDGVDDFLSTASINFTGTDKVSLFAGVRKLSDAALGVLTELSSSYNANLGTFVIFGGIGGGSPSYAFGHSGNLTGQVRTATTFAAPITNVLTCAYDASKATLQEKVRPRVDGAVPSLSGANDSGVRNFGNYPLYIGRRGGTSLPFNGHLYGLIFRGALTDDSTVSRVEKLLAGKTGVTLA